MALGFGGSALTTGGFDGEEATGKCCRVWLPDIVLPAGDRLRAALEGANGANFVHLKRRHAGATFRVFGAANPSLPPWKRLQVVAQFPAGLVLEKVEADIVDLAETACDIVADSLGLSDDQVQQAFDDIRIERSDIKFAAPKSMPPALAAGLSGVGAALDSGGSLAGVPVSAISAAAAAGAGGGWAQLGIVSKAAPSSQQLAAKRAPQPGASAMSSMPPPLAAQPVAASVSASAVAASAPAPIRRKPALRQSAVAAADELAAAPPGASGAAFVAAALTGVAHHSRPQGFDKGGRIATAAAAGRPAASEVAEAVAMPPPAAPPAKKPRRATPDAKAPQGWPRGQVAEALASPPVATAGAAGAAQPATVVSEGALAAARPQGSGTGPSEAANSAEPTPASDSKLARGHARPAAAAAVAVAVVPAESVEDSQPAASEEASGSTSGESDEEAEEEEGSESSEGEGDEEMDVASDAGKARAAQVQAPASVPAAAASADGLAAASLVPQAPAKIGLFKLGEKCCEVVAAFGGGHLEPESLSDKLEIDQRAKLDHCREHLQFAGDLVTIWTFEPAGKKHAKGFAALIAYFVSKQRVGLAEAAGYSVYVVPPDAAFLEALGLDPLSKEKAGCLLALQVPSDVEGEEEEEEQQEADGDAEVPKPASDKA